jgi:hypothetical protein
MLGIRKATISLKFTGVIPRFRLQEEGRAAPARLRRQLPAQPARRPAHVKGQDSDGRKSRPSPTTAKTRRPRVQALERPVRRPARVFRVYQGQPSGAVALQSAHPPHRARLPPPAHARHGQGGDRRRLRRRHLRGGRRQGRHHRRHAVRRGFRHPPRAAVLPRARHLDVHRAEVEGRPGEDGHRAPAPRRPRIRRSASLPTPTPARPSSPAWASSTSRSSATACSASSRSRPTPASRRSPTARPSPETPRRGQVHPPVGRPRPVRPCVVTLEPNVKGKGVEVINEIVGGVHPEGIHQAHHRGHSRGRQQRRRRRLPGHRRHRPHRRRLVPRGRLLGTRLQDGRHLRLQGRDGKAKPDPARADHEGRSHRARGIPGRPHGRHQPPPRPHPGHGVKRDGACIITAHVPLETMFGYATDIRSLSKGRASYSMEPSHFEQVPASLLTKIVETSTRAPPAPNPRSLPA